MFKNITIGKKLGYTVLTVSLVSLVIGFLILNWYANKIEDDVDKNFVKNLQIFVNEKFQSKKDVGISNAVSIANDHSIKLALKKHDRRIAIASLKNLSKSLKQSTPFKNVKIHIHTKTNNSFVRSWELSRHGDDLSSFRHSVAKVNQSKVAVNTFELGKAGLSLRSVVPITSNNATHLGSLEFMQGLNSVAKSFDKNNDGFVLLMDKRVSSVKTFKEDIIYKTNYIISQKFINQEFLDDANNIDIDKLLQNKRYETSKYLYTYVDVKDFRNEKLGIAIVGSPLEKVNIAVNSAKEVINIALLVMVLLVVFILIFISISVKKMVVAPLNEFNDGIKHLITDNSGNSTIRIEKKSNDELGDVADNFNAYLQKIDDGIQEDKLMIDEVVDIVHKAKEGFYSYTITRASSNPQMEELKNQLNDMMNITKNNLGMITGALIAFGNAKYTHVIEAKSSGNIGSLIKGTNALGGSISDVLCMIDNTSKRLSANANDLAATSEELSASSTQQAASLEETAAAIEEITSTITATNQQTSKMSKFAQELKHTSEEDDELAHQTGKSMGDINKATTDIAEAIQVIDQIAFQTNILSLNAAVEAATAGEAGKGFAVVAQEVRNLATRSANAANTIKDLVAYAQSKTAEGKETADKMVDSFNFLNDKVVEITQIVDEVSTATKEQMSAMDQINNAVNELDKTTQENANASEIVSSKAMALSEISEHLISVIHRTTFDNSKANSVCDVNLVYDTTKLKLDHISFKEKSFANIGSGKSFKVATHKECALGKWMKEHEGENYTQHSDWQELDKAHGLVHGKVQEYINLDATNKTDPKLYNIANEIESNTAKVFQYLDKVKTHRCENNNMDRSRDKIKLDSSNAKEYHKKIATHKSKEVLSNRTIVDSSNSKDEWTSF